MNSVLVLMCTDGSFKLFDKAEGLVKGLPNP